MSGSAIRVELAKALEVMFSTERIISPTGSLKHSVPREAGRYLYVGWGDAILPDGQSSPRAGARKGTATIRRAYLITLAERTPASGEPNQYILDDIMNHAEDLAVRLKELILPVHGFYRFIPAAIRVNSSLDAPAVDLEVHAEYYIARDGWKPYINDDDSAITEFWLQINDEARETLWTAEDGWVGG